MAIEIISDKRGKRNHARRMTWQDNVDYPVLDERLTRTLPCKHTDVFYIKNLDYNIKHRLVFYYENLDICEVF